MKNKLLFFFLLAIFNISCHSQVKLESHKEILKLMGTRFEVTATAQTKEIATQAVQSGIEEIQRIEALISSWKKSSQTSDINRNAGIKAVPVDPELYDLIARSLKISQLTDGAFDISFASMERLYTFDKAEHDIPSEDDRLKAISLINYKSIQLNPENHSVYLPVAGMRIGFGGIGKGYAANKAKSIMSSIEGVVGGVVNASGDLVVWGDNGRKDGWPIQISDPKDINKTMGWLNINNASVVTSGDYEKYFMHEGVRYAHIVDPKTGLPTTGVKSATIVSPDAEVGDALATSMFVLGAEKGIALINQLKNIEALIITDHDKVLTSQQLILNKY